MGRELLEAGLDTMNFLQGLVTNLRDINSATLTGAVDVVFVQQEDGSYKSTPFHVRSEGSTFTLGHLIIWNGLPRSHSKL